MVMIPKPNKDHPKVRGCRPIALSNTVGKLGEKVTACRFQRATNLFHELHYGSRKGRSVTDAMMLTLSKAQREMGRGNQVIMLAKDMVSTFSNLRRAQLIVILAEGATATAARFCGDFSSSRIIQISWDSIRRGDVRVADGTLQGSPLNHALWLIYLAGTSTRAQKDSGYR